MPFERDDGAAVPVIRCRGGDACPSWLRTYRLRRTTGCAAHTPQHWPSVPLEFMLVAALGLLRHHRLSTDPPAWELMEQLFPEHREKLQEMLEHKAISKLRGE